MKNKYTSQINVPIAKGLDLFHLSDKQLAVLLKATDIELLQRRKLLLGGFWVNQAVYQCYKSFFNPDFRLRKSENNKLYSINKKFETRKELTSCKGTPFHSFCIRYADKTKLKPMTYIERKRYR